MVVQSRFEKRMLAKIPDDPESRTYADAFADLVFELAQDANRTAFERVLDLVLPVVKEAPPVADSPQDSDGLRNRLATIAAGAGPRPDHPELAPE
ncbi:unnamed protein product [marine sediment metagenome]|uniref:Uncharacterized protein n=1 Tax=marine sediment metagenome TaxID=412755 RepID=X0RVP6_9ZZZZ